MSQGSGRPEGRERDGEMALGGAVSTHVFIDQVLLDACNLWHLKTIPMATLKMTDQKSL